MDRLERVKEPLRWLLAALMIGSGIAHFAIPATYEALIPPAFPSPRLLVYASGVAELAFGAGLLIPRWSRWAAWGIVATLIAVYPANIYHAVSGGLDHPELPEMFADPVFAWVRLPFQLVLVAWAWWYTRPTQ